MSIEGIRLRLLRLRRVYLSKWRRKKINKEKFTIISNNCWGGETYEAYGLIKQSPTIGLFFMASDYIKFISRIKEYLSKELIFIDPKESVFFDQLKDDKSYGTYPVAKLGDIEIFFMHYDSPESALKKWNRRVKRIDWNHVLYKFNDQNGCTEKDIDDFISLPYKSKICFTVKDEYVKQSYIYKIKAPRSHEFIRASYEPFGKEKGVDINQIINCL
ncbi:DUF1919 domain-containing protein [Limosilactobacillus fermentum]|uniref:DUF1919 domain-containing protein n=1 Tax=Limosilactobacillus fermentum TaxID=1613 RepID=UPI0007093746|nr:DUF1919 domain-containing protein [Limosilactobacillus fermentum]